ncbi:MAG: hypothetical protein J5483_07595 [Lachnospiraceae bacterium]|nr:hypothetical protein [Lachnospiraceae bacterium]
MKQMKKITLLTMIALLLAAFWPGKAFAAGGAYVSDTYLEIALGDTAYVSIGVDNAAGQYSVSSSGSVMANDGGWLDNDTATIGIYAASEGDGTVEIYFPTLATYDEEDLEGTTLYVTVHVYTPDGGYTGDYGKSGNEDPNNNPEQPTEKLGVWIDDMPYSVLTDLSEVEIPKGFTAADGTYDGEKVKTITCGDGLVLYALWNHWDGSVIFRTYDENTKTFKEPDTITQGGNTYYLLKIPDGIVIPAEYKEKEVTINGKKIKALVSEWKDYEDFYYIYAMNNGNKGFYSYDQKEGSLQRVITLKATQENVEEETEETPVQKSKIPSRKVFMIALGVAVVIIIILLILLISARKRAREMEDDDY